MRLTNDYKTTANSILSKMCYTIAEFKRSN